MPEVVHGDPATLPENKAFRDQPDEYSPVDAMGDDGIDPGDVLGIHPTPTRQPLSIRTVFAKIVDTIRVKNVASDTWQTFRYPIGTGQYGTLQPQQVLPKNPLRLEARVKNIGPGVIEICHTAQTPQGDGWPLAVNEVLIINTKGPVFAVLASGTTQGFLSVLAHQEDGS